MAHSLYTFARIISWVFRPTYFPLVGFILLFRLTYLSLLSIEYQAMVLLLVATFTIWLPQLGIYVFRRTRGLARHHLRHRQHRYIPYAITMLSYMACLHIMNALHVPRWMGGIIVGGLMTQIVCTLINLRYKVSSHCAGAGGACGVLTAYSLIFGFNAVWWLVAFIIVSGMVGTARMLLRQHTLGEVVTGSVVGAVCGFIGVII